MALVYKRSDSKTTRAYERSPGMEPNPGVNALTVVSNPGRRTSRRVSENPFQWIEGRGQRHRHVSPQYQSLKGASGWKKRNPRSDARLYPVDSRGTIVSRPVSKQLLDNGGEMAYNIGALRRAMRSNPRGRRTAVSEMETPGGVKVSSHKRRTTKNKRRTTKRRKPTANRRGTRKNARRTSRKPKRNSRRRVSANRRRSRRKSRAPKRNSRRRSSRRRSSRRRSSRRRMTANRRRSRRSRAPKRNSRRRRSRRTTANRRRSRRSSRRPRRNATKRGGKRRTSKKAKFWNGRRVSAKRGAEYLDKYLSKGYMPTTAPRYRTGKSRSGIPPVLVYPIPKGQGRLQKRKVRRTSKSRSPNRRSTKAVAVGASYGGGRKRRMAANRRRSRRTSRRSTRRNSRRSSRRRMTSNRRRSRRSSRRRSRRRMSANRRRSRRSSRRRRSRRPVRKNLLSTSKVRWGRAGKSRTGRPVGGTYQILAYGPGSRTRTGSKLKGYPVYVPGHVISTAAVRKYRGLGGAAKDSHRRAKRRGYRERKKYPRRRVTRNTRRTSMRRNRRRSRRKSTRRSSRRRMSRNPKYVVANRRRRRSRRKSRMTSNRRRRRVRKNLLGGADLMQDVLVPVAGATGGFVAARVLSNGLANIEGIRNILDKDKPAADAMNTKIAANVIGILATLGLSTQVPIIKRNRGALIAGMGLALTDRLLGKVQGDAAQYLSGFGEYVSQPLGEYVSQPLGEYVSQPLGETLYAAAGMGSTAMQAAAGYAEGVDPGNQAGVDHSMDVMEAAAGMGTMYATAGMGETLYAAAGLGAEADAGLKEMYAQMQPPFASIQTPTDIARPVTASMPYARPVPDTLVTPEGRGYAGGLFARNLFAGML